MARVPLMSLGSGVVMTPGGLAIGGAQVLVVTHGTSNQVTVFAAEQGATALAQPLSTNNLGQIPGWVTDGQTLDFQVTYAGVTVTQEADPVRGDDTPLASSVGQPNGLASLDGTGKVLSGQLPSSASGGSIDTTTEEVLVIPTASAHNGIVVKSPDSNWGDESVIPYGNGQAFMLLKEETTGAVLPDDLVLFRIARDGGIGTSGGLHVATGLRQRAGYAPTQAVWIDLNMDVVGLVIRGVASPQSSSYLLIEDHTPTVLLEVKGSGKLEYNAPQARVKNSAAISIPNNAATVLTFDTNVFDTDGIHSTTSNTDRLTAPVDGVYLLTGHVEWASNVAGVRQVFLSGSVGTLGAQLGPPANGASTQQSLATIAKLTAGQFAQLAVFQNSGGALNIDAAGTSPIFTMSYLGRGK